MHKQIYFILLLLGCSSLKKSMITSGENSHEIAIYNAIWDFSTNCRLFEQGSVFMVTFKDSVFNKGSWVRVDEKTFKDKRTHEWRRGDLCDRIIRVEIGINSAMNAKYTSEESSIFGGWGNKELNRLNFFKSLIYGDDPKDLYMIRQGFFHYDAHFKK